MLLLQAAVRIGTHPSPLQQTFFFHLCAAAPLAGTAAISVLLSQRWDELQGDKVKTGLAAALDVPVRYGVIVGAVQADSPADRAGLVAGDVITSIDGRQVRDVEAVRNRIGLVRLGRQLELEIIRDGDSLIVPVTVEQLPETNPLLRGATLTEQTLRNGRRFLLIENVQADSQLGRAGVQDGDIILSVNRQGVGTLRDLQAIVRASGDELLVLLQRGRATLYVSLQKE